jgi:MOSC domain-containing protein YiiM
VATLLGIAIKPRDKGPMQELDCALISREHGVEGCRSGRPGRRQVTLLSLDSWQAACGELGIDLPWSARRANLLVDSLPLEQSVGAHIHIGEAVLEITGEADPCKRMAALHPGLFDALAREWRGGVTCRVVVGGVLTPGGAVSMDHSPSAA